ncbi:pyridoxal phosphate-dependent decarboxylase family protein [Humibacter ginsenosidimutans]|uniref:Aspartate aminotransferase family protein n=1 Tax=Humibacter ginsenosidimutans TaxID=2599293 RepID=A0A5B8M116_9MICO|nr:pyridoxal-dependent decarboxylase [Humibacter ginsenosidimutans]QDZ14367.1 aspartate aminotransferase family protein [Humibacter ginsenosidimutans]
MPTDGTARAPEGARREEILERLRALRAADAPTHGGRVLSYVYDSGRAELDQLAAAAAAQMQAVNGLDPTTFTSVAVLEREVVGFARELLGGDDEVVGSVTSGGTESCLLAVKTARDLWRAAGGVGTPRVVAPVTVHAAFRKAAKLFGAAFDGVPVSPETGTVGASAIVERLGDDVALVVVSAPSYPFAALDPVVEVAAACRDAGIACHVDACIGGWILPFWVDDDGAPLSSWNLSVPGVTSLSADLHKYGYAPKGVSVLLHRGRDRHRAQYFATTDWPGYPVVNPTLLGSKSAGALAAAWAIIQALGAEGFGELAAQCLHATWVLRNVIERIEGLRVMGEPVGPLLAVAVDESVPPERRVDPHHWADAVRASGWILQQQPGLVQSDGVRLPHTTHLTITPVTESKLGELSPVLSAAADAVRGIPAVSPADVLNALPGGGAAVPQDAAALDSDSAAALLGGLGLLGGANGALPEQMAPFLALIEALPHPVSERLLTELLARVVEPRPAP